MKTTIFFDLDDTLWDTIGNARLCLNELYNDYNIDRFYPTFSDFYKVYFDNTTKLWDKYSKGLIDKSTLIRERFRMPFIKFDTMSNDTADEMNNDFFRRIVTKTGLIDGAVDLLEYLKPNYKMHIISNGFSELQDRKINGSGLGGYFDKVILSDMIGINKPDRRIFEHLIEQAGVDAEEVIMIGDNLKTDIGGAMNAGIEQIWFNPDNENSGDIKPTYIVKRLEEIKSIL